MDILAKLLETARSWPHTHGIRVGYATIGDQTWPCVRYSQTMENLPGSPALARGEKTYERQGIYCVGELPKGYEKSRYRLRGDSLAGHAMAFPFEGIDWYIAGHSPKVIEAKFAFAHPFGRMFILAPWQVPSGESIDHYYHMDSGKEYQRKPLSIRYVDEDSLRSKHHAGESGTPSKPRRSRHRAK